MLDTLQRREVEISGVEEIGQFTIVANAKAFKVLISGLYSRKAEAVVRELCTNAFDSHKAAGCLDRPFKVTLPDRWDAQFAVRDYGTSLSHRDIMGLYTTVFASTKDQDNNAVGKFGLGSKVPFAYTDTFTVTRWLDGEKSIYNAFMDEGGIPRIALFHREESDEERGIEVSFPVAERDRDDFKLAAKRVFLGFDVRPICNHTMPDLADAVVGDFPEGKLYKNTGLVPQGISVRQGCVLYPVDARAMPHHYLFTIDECIVLDVPIGDVDITPSRETIEYTPRTVANINAAIERFAQAYVQRFNERIEAAGSLYDAWQERRSILRAFSWRGKTLITRKWRGRDIVDPEISGRRLTGLEKRFDVRISTITRLETNWAINPDTALDFHSGNAGHLPTFVYSESKTRLKHLARRLRGLTDHLSSGPQRVYLVEGAGPDHPIFEWMRAAIGKPAVLPVKEWVDLTTVPYDVPKAVKKPALQIFRHDGSGWEEVCEKKHHPEIMDTRSCYWVPLHRAMTSHRTGEVLTKEQTNAMLNWLASVTKNSVDVVVGVRPEHIEAFEPQKNWIDLRQTIADQLARCDLKRSHQNGWMRGWHRDKLQKQMEFLIQVYDMGCVLGDRLNGTRIARMLRRLDKWLLPPNHSHHAIVLELMTANEREQQDQWVAKHGLSEGNYPKELRTLEKELRQRYPMLRLVEKSLRFYASSAEENEILLDYIHKVDKMRLPANTEKRSTENDA